MRSISRLSSELLGEVVKRGTMTRTEMNDYFDHHISQTTFDKILADLEDAHFIRMHITYNENCRPTESWEPN